VQILRDDPATNFKADIFYRVIDRAVTQLPGSDRETRQELYDRAMGMVASKLRGQDPSLIARERRALEKAIRRVEANVGGSQKHRFGNPPGDQRVADATVPSSPLKPRLQLLPKLLLAILIGAVVAAAVAQLPIPWRRLLIWCCGI
jgi:hypothetical protein